MAKALLVRLNPDDLPSIVDYGSVVTITGTSDATRERVTFAGDRRSMCGLIGILHDGLEVPASVEPWQVRAREAVS